MAIAATFIVAACSSSSADSSGTDESVSGGDVSYDAPIGQDAAINDVGAPASEGAVEVAGTSSEATYLPAGLEGASFDEKVIRDGSVDLKIDLGTFGAVSTKIRGIAGDLGGYVASGSSNVDVIQDERYAVGGLNLCSCH